MDATNVWVHFQKIDNDETRSKCKYCKKDIVVSTDTSSLLTHLTSCKELSKYGKMNENLKPLVWCIEGVTDVCTEGSIYTLTSLGTGFSVSNRLIMTCAHVVKNANSSTQIKVHKLDNSFKGFAKIVYLRRESDLALLEVLERHDFDAVKFSRDRSFSVGQPLVTIGNPPDLVGSFLVGNVCYQCKNVKKSIKDKKKTCATHVSESQTKNRVLGDVWNKEVFRSCTIPRQYEFQKSLNPSVPIIQCHGFNVDHGNSGGPVFNNAEELVGMIHATSVNDDIVIHVTELEDFLNDYNRGKKRNP